ncbi:MAG: hypothetical protein AAGK47_06855 [Bacteroidota bacterium]
MFTFGMVVILTALMLSLVMAQPAQHQPQYGNKQKSIFRRDLATNRLLIHSQSVGARLLRLTLRKEHRVVLSDDLSRIAADAVYDLDLSQLTKGRYVVELLTVQEENIREEILVE